METFAEIALRSSERLAKRREQYERGVLMHLFTQWADKECIKAGPIRWKWEAEQQMISAAQNETQHGGAVKGTS